MKFVIWYYKQPPIVKALFNSCVSAFAFIFSAIIPNELVNSLQIFKFYQKALIYIGVFSLVFISYFLAFVLFKSKKEKMEAEQKAEDELTLLAYTKCDKIITDEMAMYSNNCSIEKLFVGEPLNIIQKIVSAAYETFDDYYGNSVNPTERIKFEVTFMSKSYIDGGITIPASQNRENRIPTSLQLRKGRADFYNNTITASIYREARPSIHIIEDTSDPRSGYEELYPNQQKRIQSTIVFPVLSNENILLGTLVVHCDKKNFFRIEKAKFWSELLEIFAKRLAYEKLYLDNLVKTLKHTI